MKRCSFAGLIVFVFLLYFIISYTALIKNKKTVFFLFSALWIPPLISVYKNFSENAVLRDFPYGFWFLYTEIQTTIYNLASIILLIIFYIKNKTNKSRIHFYILSGSGIILVILSWAADYFFGFRGSQNIIPFWLLLWIGILLYTIKKYRFISISPEFISRDITENIEEGIVLLDPDLKIIFTNTTIRSLLNIKEGISIQLDDIVFEKHILYNELSKLIKSSEISFRTRINFISMDSGKKLPMDLKIKKVIDVYNDITGFLMITSRVKDIEQLKTLYKISQRELDVIFLLLIGRTNKNIANFLELSERTIETHIVNIYNKLGVNNRIELLNMLSEFNIFYESIKHPI